MEMQDCLNKIKEDLASMVGTFPVPAVAVVTVQGEKKAKHKKAEVDKEQNGVQEEV